MSPTTTWLSPFEGRVLWARRRRWIALTFLAFLLSLLLDQPVFHWLAPADQHAKDVVEARGWVQMFRAAGYFPTWILIGAAILLHDQPLPRSVRSRGWLVLLSAGLSGLAAEVLKRVIARERPSLEHGGAYVYRGFMSGFSHPGNLGLPSSHVAVAFGGAFMLGHLYPRIRPVALLAAAGCAVARMAAGAHYFSDAFGAALIGYAIARALRPRQAQAWRTLLLP
jgi:membrane-associated phospholipid phosphatase